MSKRPDKRTRLAMRAAEQRSNELARKNAANPQVIDPVRADSCRSVWSHYMSGNRIAATQNRIDWAHNANKARSMHRPSKVRHV